MSTASRTPRRRGLPAWLLVVAFVVVPLVEIYFLIQVGQVIGALWTIVLLVLASIVGGWLVKREGAKAWRALNTALASGRMPSRELADGALILIGGTLMLTPGFVTDLVGITLILPFTRPYARKLLATAVSRRLVTARRPGPAPGGPVVRGEVVDDE